MLLHLQFRHFILLLVTLIINYLAQITALAQLNKVTFTKIVFDLAAILLGKYQKIKGIIK